MLCKKCNKEIYSNEKCPYCGQLQSQPLENTISQLIECPNCKQKIPFEQGFCNHCGYTWIKRSKGGCGCLIAIIVWFVIVFCFVTMPEIFIGGSQKNTKNIYDWQRHIEVELSDTDIQFLNKKDFNLLNGMSYVETLPILSGLGFELSGAQRIFSIDRESLINVTQEEFETFTQSVLEDLYLIDGKGADWGIEIVIFVDNSVPLMFMWNNWECVNGITLERREHSIGWSQWYIGGDIITSYPIKTGTLEQFNQLMSNYK